ncbi:lysoplasmalogenase [Clostridium ihumii]|uniref:lysoplasmalogenase n=1 Tax=Clostridium ihumii TaxID=1470356 RepID=UPI00058C0364|nr:lysoplasmalogenase [Clostridium ihumii]
MELQNEWIIIIAIIQFGMIISDSFYKLRKCRKINVVNGELHSQVKMMFSFSMILMAFVFWECSANEKLKPYLMLLFIGMTFSTIGDIIMARIVKVKDRLSYAIIFFILAHVSYMGSYILATSKLEGNFICLIFIIPIGYIFTTIIWSKFVKNKMKSKKINYLSLVYSLVIVTMMMISLNLTITTTTKFLLTTVGAIVFILSDLIIGVSEIKEKGPKNQSIWVWITYVIGQMCIIYNYLLFI